ncbi:hypothetical protein MKW98_021842, partial [Papaver atlanticum]
FITHDLEEARSGGEHKSFISAYTMPHPFFKTVSGLVWTTKGLNMRNKSRRLST